MSCCETSKEFQHVTERARRGKTYTMATPTMYSRAACTERPSCESGAVVAQMPATPPATEPLP